MTDMELERKKVEFLKGLTIDDYYLTISRGTFDEMIDWIEEGLPSSYASDDVVPYIVTFKGATDGKHYFHIGYLIPELMYQRNENGCWDLFVMKKDTFERYQKFTYGETVTKI